MGGTRLASALHGVRIDVHACVRACVRTAGLGLGSASARLWLGSPGPRWRRGPRVRSGAARARG